MMMPDIKQYLTDPGARRVIDRDAGAPGSQLRQQDGCEPHHQPDLGHVDGGAHHHETLKRDRVISEVGKAEWLALVAEFSVT